MFAGLTGSTSTSIMSGKVVGGDKVPEFPKQAQEFLGTVRL